MIVVSDTSPILHLSRAGHLTLLRELYGEVFIPPAVARELEELAARHGEFQFSPTCEWVSVRELPTEQIDARVIDANLDAGETEAISLALALKCDLLLVDERRGRAVATTLGLHIVGVCGVLVASKRRGLLPAVRPVLDRLRANGFHLHDSVRSLVLSCVDERDE